MPKDYKHRAATNQTTSIQRWRVIFAIGLVLVFAIALYFVSRLAGEQLVEIEPQESQQVVIEQPLVNEVEKPLLPQKPRFDFYTILPEETAILVPEYEIKTQIQAAKIGKAKSTQYMIQAGAFRRTKDADARKATLALLGIESHIEQKQRGNVIWNRVKIGPYSNAVTIDHIKKRLKQNNIDIVVMEVKKR